MNYSVCLFSSTAHHSHPALCSCRQNMKDHPPSIPFGWSWPTEDLIRVSGGKMEIKTVSLTLTPLLWVEGRVGGLPLAGHNPWFNSAVPSLGSAFVVSLLPPCAFGSLFLTLPWITLICRLGFLLEYWNTQQRTGSILSGNFSQGKKKKVFQSGLCCMFMDDWTNHLNFIFRMEFRVLDSGWPQRTQ